MVDLKVAVSAADLVDHSVELSVVEWGLQLDQLVALLAATLVGQTVVESAESLVAELAPRLDQSVAASVAE